MGVFYFMINLENKSALVRKAIEFAKSKHNGQIRKFENTPYFIHPRRVAHILYQFKESKHIEFLVSACYLHDTVEDTDTTLDEIRNEFGEFIASIVYELTSSSEKIRVKGKAKYLADKMTKMSSYAFSIKLADRIDNVNKIATVPDKFKSKYIQETLYILSYIKENRNNITNSQQNMINEIERHISDNSALDIDYLTFDSYMKRVRDEKNTTNK